MFNQNLVSYSNKPYKNTIMNSVLFNIMSKKYSDQYISKAPSLREVLLRIKIFITGFYVS